MTLATGCSPLPSKYGMDTSLRSGHVTLLPAVDWVCLCHCWCHVQPALEALQSAAEAAGLQLRKLDKKAEKSLVQDHRNALEEKLNSQEDPAEALSLVVPLLVAQVLLNLVAHQLHRTRKPQSWT